MGDFDQIYEGISYHSKEISTVLNGVQWWENKWSTHSNFGMFAKNMNPDQKQDIFLGCLREGQNWAFWSEPSTENKSLVNQSVR
jgi:hypothetical protein